MLGFEASGAVLSVPELVCDSTDQQILYGHKTPTTVCALGAAGSRNGRIPSCQCLNSAEDRYPFRSSDSRALHGQDPGHGEGEEPAPSPALMVWEPSTAGTGSPQLGMGRWALCGVLWTANVTSLAIILSPPLFHWL